MITEATVKSKTHKGKCEAQGKKSQVGGCNLRQARNTARLEAEVKEKDFFSNKNSQSRQRKINRKDCKNLPVRLYALKRGNRYRSPCHSFPTQYKFATEGKNIAHALSTWKMTSHEKEVGSIETVDGGATAFQ